MKSMDLLKSALADRQAKAQKTISEVGQKWVRRGDAEARRKEEYLEAQREEAERQKAAEEAQLERFAQNVAVKGSKNAVLNNVAEDEALLAEAMIDDDDAEPPLGLTEVVDRLRDMNQPITLFGETDMVRYRRLRQCEKEQHEGKQNPDVVMLEEVHESQRLSVKDGEPQAADDDEDEDEEGKEKSEDEGGGGAADDKSDSEDEADPEAADDKSDSEDEGDAGDRGACDDKSDSEDEGGAAPKATLAADEGTKLQDKPAEPAEEDVEVNTDLMDKCDFIRAWARKALKAWEKEIAEKPDEEKKTARCKTEVAAHRQVRRDVRPLQKRLRMYVMDEWLLGKIHHIIQFADEREYRNASEAYLDLSIGKAAWPVGIGCGGSMLMEDAIGLHDRFNRMANVKDIAFALNDDVTRKFVQALKRLMNVAQRYWPPSDPSKASG